MKIRSGLVLAFSALLLVFALGTNARASLSDSTSSDDTSLVSEPSDDEAAPANECLPEDEAVNQAYECPRGIPYCQRASQCDTYCGGVGYGACEFGCCRCAA